MATLEGIAGRSKAGIDRLVYVYSPRTWMEKGLLWTLGVVAATYVLVIGALWFIWDSKPDAFDVHEAALAAAGGDAAKLVPGYATTATVTRIAETLLGKPGGYLYNDLAPPGVLMDNMPNWEYGVLGALRDVVRGLRNDFGRSQTQSLEDRDLQLAEQQFNFDPKSWMLPSAESEYAKGIAALQRYQARLADENQQDGQFYARADNLRDYLAIVEKRLGNLSQRLSASVGQLRYDTALAGDPQAHQSTSVPEERAVKTPWTQIDDVFYEARGYSWALLHLLRALEIDFRDVLASKNALVSLRQIIRELEGTQETVWSPVILNGTGFGLVANHSLIMASYISRANAAIIDLRSLMLQG